MAITRSLERGLRRVGPVGLDPTTQSTTTASCPSSVRKVGTLTRSDVQAWVGELHAAKLSPATVHHHYVALKKALRHALDD